MLLRVMSAPILLLLADGARAHALGAGGASRASMPSGSVVIVGPVLEGGSAPAPDGEAERPRVAGAHWGAEPVGRQFAQEPSSCGASVAGAPCQEELDAEPRGDLAPTGVDDRPWGVEGRPVALVGMGGRDGARGGVAALAMAASCSTHGGGATSGASSHRGT